MGYRSLAPEDKFQALKEVWASPRSISKVAKKYGVSRPALYHWSDLAKQSVLDALAEKPGPKKKSPFQELAQESISLHKRVEELSIIIERLSQQPQMGVSTSPNEQSPRPGKCPACGCERVWKNGSWPVKEGRQNRFVCSNCHRVLYIMVKKTPSPDGA
ncbi:MAG: transposase [Peptococcaceae bacterium]|nr:transposase [Peptococcaceae bacterium]